MRTQTHKEGNTCVTQTCPWGFYLPNGHRLLCSDGVIRAARLAQTADTFFSVPASIRISGKSISGYMTREENPNGKNVYSFHQHTSDANGAPINSGLPEWPSKQSNIAKVRTFCAQTSLYPNMKAALFKNLASMVDARLTCIARENHEWLSKHTERISALVKEHMPSGAGFDHGTSLDLDVSTGERLVFQTGFHHMNDGGYYDGWTEHQVTCTPSLAHDFLLKISGRNRDEIKEHIHEVFSISLKTETEF